MAARSALAGVSRLTFYEHSDSKEDCFLASFDEIVAHASERIMAAYNGEHEGIMRLIAAYAAFVAEIVERPKAARLALVDVLAVGPGALGRTEHTRLAFERMTNESAGGLLNGVTPPEIVLKGIVGGIWQIARWRLLTDRLEELPALGGEMLGWVISYNSQGVERLAPGPVEGPTQAGPPSTNGSPPALRAGSPGEREGPREQDEYKRILRTVAELAAREGYAELSTARIIQEAEVPDQSFFERFQSCEECFLAALQLLCAEALAKGLPGARGGKDWPDKVQLGIAALLSHTARDRTFARVAFVEVFGAGATGLSVQQELLKRVADMLVADAPREQAPSGVMAEGIVGAVWTVAFDRVVRDLAHELPALAGYASYLTLAPIIGADAAVEAILSGPAEPGPV